MRVILNNQNDGPYLGWVPESISLLLCLVLDATASHSDARWYWHLCNKLNFLLVTAICFSDWERA